MNKNIKILIGVIALVVIIAGASVAYTALSKNYEEQEATVAASAEASTAAAAGASSAASANDSRKAAPDFTVYDVEGNPVSLSDYLGQPVVINFWASWCPPCKAELPDFEKLYGEKQDEVVFLMIDLVDGQRETAENGAGYIESNGYTFPILFDTDQSAAYAYGISSIPTTLFIDREGYIVDGKVGQISESGLRRGIELITQ